MKLSIDLLPARQHAWKALLLILSIAPAVSASGASVQVCGSSQELAFARYVASQQQSDAFDTSERVGILIEASLPDLYKSAAVLAVRGQDENERKVFRIVQAQGDGTVGEEVIARYLTLRQHMEDLPPSSTAITPANYKFHFARSVKTGAATAYIYDITPKKHRLGLLAGQLWMDADTGREVMLAGRLSQMPDAPGERAEVVRDTKLINGSAFARITHVVFTLPELGRAEVVITEVALNAQTMGGAIQNMEPGLQRVR